MDRRLIENKLESLRHCLVRIEQTCPDSAELLTANADAQDVEDILDPDPQSAGTRAPVTLLRVGRDAVDLTHGGSSSVRGQLSPGSNPALYVTNMLLFVHGMEHQLPHKGG